MDADAGQSIDVIARMLWGIPSFFFLEIHLFLGEELTVGCGVRVSL